jgi:hypothetical protein
MAQLWAKTGMVHPQKNTKVAASLTEGPNLRMRTQPGYVMESQFARDVREEVL